MILVGGLKKITFGVLTFFGITPGVDWFGARGDRNGSVFWLRVVTGPQKWSMAKSVALPFNLSFFWVIFWPYGVKNDTKTVDQLVSSSFETAIFGSNSPTAHLNGSEHLTRPLARRFKILALRVEMLIHLTGARSRKRHGGCRCFL